MKQMYFASPLFYNVELEYIAKVVKMIKDKFENVNVFLPQEADAINDKNGFADSKMIAKYDTEAVLAFDLMVAVLDGLMIDPGVASEIGVAYAHQIPLIGLFTDPRVLGAFNPKKLNALGEIAES